MDTTNHRTLFTGDVNYLFARNCHPQQADRYDASVIRAQVDLLADSGVDTYLVNVNGQLPWYPSKALDNVITGYTRGDRNFVRSIYPALDETFTQAQLDQRLGTATAMLDRYLDLVEDGIDWAAEAAAACHARGVSPWLSVRMNDAHGGNSWDTCYMNCPPQRDAANRLEGKPLNPNDPETGSQAVCDFSKPVVRDYYLTLIREVVEDYDFNGIELDWLRMPYCMNPPASPAEIELMLDWMREVRKITIAKAEKTGKAFPLGLRIPAQIGALKTHGLDVIAMAEQGLIDFVSPSNFWQTTWDIPYDRLRAKLGHKVAIYGVIEGAPNWLYVAGPDRTGSAYRLLPCSESWTRGNAASKLAMGVDGIAFYNFHCADAKGVHSSAGKRSANYDAIEGISQLDDLRGKPKQYTLSTGFTLWSPQFFETAAQLPAFVEQNDYTEFQLSMCREPSPESLELIVQILIDKTTEPPPLGVSLNGSWPEFSFELSDELLEPVSQLTHHLPERIGMNFKVDASRIEEGMNVLRVYNGGGAMHAYQTDPTPAVRILSVELVVR